MGILLSREFYLGYFLPILYSILLERWLEAREFVRFTIFLFLFKQRSRWISYLAICRLGSLEILELLHSFVGSFCQLEFMRLSLSLCLCCGGVSKEFLSRVFLFVSSPILPSFGLFLGAKTREFVKNGRRRARIVFEFSFGFSILFQMFLDMIHFHSILFESIHTRI